MTDDLFIVIRNFHAPTDAPYIYSTWSKYSWYSPKAPLRVKKRNFFRQKIGEIRELLDKSIVHIACMKDDPDFIVGYIVVYEGKMEWSCIKKSYRNQGIEGLLVHSVKGKIDGQE